nr:ATP-grasp domain-containing protein [Nocardioidaceae bacterium]
MPERPSEVDDWEWYLSEPVRDRPVIVSFELLAGMTRTVANLQRWGARRPLLVADGRGTGAIPEPAAADVVMLPDEAFGSLTDQVRARMRPESRLTPAVGLAVDSYDPAGDAWWWVGPVSPNTALLGRPVLGGRPPGQAALEDKMLVDSLLAEIDAPVSCAIEVPATYDELMRATSEVLTATGEDQVVWAGDALGSTNGGGDYVRWVRTTAQVVDAAEFFASRCRRVRVSAFLEGVPCSIHGLCLPDGVVVLRPVELATLRDLDRGRFVYAGMGTTWDPAPADAEQMRGLARALGEHLTRRHGYRGGFGIDGVMTADGFRVTEINPRFSGGLTRLARVVPAAHLELVQVNALLGRDVGRSAAEIEERSQAMLDDNRFIDAAGLSGRRLLDDHVEIAVTAGDARLEAADLSDPDVAGTDP